MTGNHDVLGLDVTMNNACRMGRCQSACNLNRKLKNINQLDASLYSLAQSLAVDELSSDEVQVTTLASS
jgi:hypothetical protein